MPDRRKHMKSKYTADRGIPGAFEGETVTRRRFMVGSAHALGGVAAAAFTLPALGFALGPVFARQEAHWEDIGATSDFPSDTYVPVVFTITPGIGEIGKTTAYVRKRNPAIDTEPADQYDQYVAITSRCAHLGCAVRYVEAAQRFVCPCHGGVYDFRGLRVGGPPPRPLDRFYTRVAGDRVQIGPRYSVNSFLQKFTPRDPGEDLNGLGEYLWPPRFTPARVKGG